MRVSDNTVIFSVDLSPDLLGPDYTNDDGKTFVIANAVSGAMDIVRPQEVHALESLRGDVESVDWSVLSGLRDRGYIYDNEQAEKVAYDALISNYFTAIQEAPFQFMFIPSFVCNLACPYCFEGELTTKSPRMTEDMVDAAFDSIPTIQDLHDNRGQPYVTLFGGEPLLNTPAQRESIEQILRRAYDRAYPVTAITNGVDLDAYVPMLKRYECLEVQVSLDGTPPKHDERRVFRGGKPTFHRIERGIDAAVEAGVKVLIRMLVDKETIWDLPNFAAYAQAKGWIDSPLVTIFYGFTKRTTFLYVTPDHPEEKRQEMVRGDVTLAMHEDFVSMLKQNPLVDRMLRPDPARIRSAVLEGDRIHPNLQGCSAGTSVIAFDPSGRLYGCPETVGRPQHACGAYFPDLRYNRPYRDTWRHRFVDTVDMCRTCNVKLFCGGGGCPIKAWAASGGDFNTCYCPKVETVKTQVEQQLGYLLPMALTARQTQPANEANPAHAANAANVANVETAKSKEEAQWAEMKRVGSFPWMS